MKIAIEKYKLSVRQVLIVLLLATTQLCGAQLFADAVKRGIENLPSYEYKRVHFGFLIGVNATDFHIYNTGVRTTENGNLARYGEIIDLNPGINLGIVTDLRLCNNLNLRFLPGISFGERNITFVNENGLVIDDKPLRIKSTFLDFPLLLKYSAFRMRNVKPFIVGGGSIHYDLAKEKQEHLTMKSIDACWDIGAGMDFYLSYFRLSIEVRGAFGLLNMYNPNGSVESDDIPYVQAIDCMKSRIFGLTFYFE